MQYNTSSNRKELQLSEYSSYLDFIFNNSSDIFWILNPDFETIKISKSIELLTGFSCEEFLNLRIEKILTKNSYLKLKERLFTLFQDFNTVISDKIEIITKSGQIISSKISCSNIVNNFGISSNIICLYINYNSISKIKTLKEQDDKKNQEAHSFKTTVLGMLSHEFKTPLNGILGYTKLLAKECITINHKEMIDYIYQSAQRLNATLNSVTTLAALESDQLLMNNESVNIYEVIQNVALHFMPIINSKGIKFDVICNYDINIKTDENFLSQILYHLLDNSVKFTNCGHITITTNLINRNSKINIEILIEDSGIGINCEEVHNVFIPFRQLSEGIDRKYDGLGIGLTITEKLVKKLNGEIIINSEINSGTSVLIVFPTMIDSNN
jgi:two-component system, sensor histidine kinase